MINVEVVRLPNWEAHPNRSSLILSLLHLAVRIDVLSCTLHNLTYIARNFARGEFSLMDLVELHETATLGFRHEEVEPDDAKEV